MHVCMRYDPFGSLEVTCLMVPNPLGLDAISTPNLSPGEVYDVRPIHVAPTQDAFLHPWGSPRQPQGLAKAMPELDRHPSQVQRWVLRTRTSLSRRFYRD